MVSLSRIIKVNAPRSEEKLTLVLDESFWSVKREKKFNHAFKTLNSLRKNILSFAIYASRGYERPTNHYMTKLIPSLQRDQFFLALTDCLSHVVSRPTYWLNRMLSICTTKEDLLRNLSGTSGTTLLSKLEHFYTGKAPLAYPSMRNESQLLDSFMRAVEDVERVRGPGRVHSKYTMRSTDTPIRTLSLDLVDWIIESAFPLLMSRSVNGGTNEFSGDDLRWGLAPNELIVRRLMEKYGKKVQTGQFLRNIAKALLVILGEVKCAEDCLRQQIETGGASRDVRQRTHEIQLRLDCFFDILLPVISLIVTSSFAGGGHLLTSKPQLDDLIRKLRAGVTIDQLSKKRMEAIHENERLRDDEDCRLWEIRELRKWEDYLDKGYRNKVVAEERKWRDLVKGDKKGAKCDKVVETSIASALNPPRFSGDLVHSKVQSTHYHDSGEVQFNAVCVKGHTFVLRLNIHFP